MATAGTRGPVPKRSDQRRRTNDNASISKSKAGRKPRRPAVDSKWHPIAKRWYLSLATSGQVIYFEASDWAQAFFVAESMSRLLNSGRFSAQLFAAVDSATARLMVTEADRRRLRVELERESAGADKSKKTAGVIAIDTWQKKLGASG